MTSLAHKDHHLVPVPAYNAFASVHLNTVHSLPVGIRNDPIASEAARALQRDCRTYLAYVAGRAGVFQHHSEHNASDIFLVLPGPPVPFLCGGVRVEGTMAIPIGIDQPNVSGRRPLRPSHPLPLPNCYMSPFWRMIVRSPTVYEDEERVTHRLDTQDAVDFMDYVEDDYCVWRPQTSLSVLDNSTEELVELNSAVTAFPPSRRSSQISASRAET
uniref:Uncharacterized protein n=1 Tax=Mycena chlorophos TaxID=658473 RepID=A0ABQ0LKL0_MYCCL|nr:predicted protein [Mycena chlorophos]